MIKQSVKSIERLRNRYVEQEQNNFEKFKNMLSHNKQIKIDEDLSPSKQSIPYDNKIITHNVITTQNYKKLS